MSASFAANSGAGRIRHRPAADGAGRTVGSSCGEATPRPASSPATVSPGPAWAPYHRAEPVSSAAPLRDHMHHRTLGGYPGRRGLLLAAVRPANRPRRRAPVASARRCSRVHGSCSPPRAPARRPADRAPRHRARRACLRSRPVRCLRRRAPHRGVGRASRLAPPQHIRSVAVHPVVDRGLGLRHRQPTPAHHLGGQFGVHLPPSPRVADRPGARHDRVTTRYRLPRGRNLGHPRPPLAQRSRPPTADPTPPAARRFVRRDLGGRGLPVIQAPVLMLGRPVGGRRASSTSAVAANRAAHAASPPAPTLLPPQHPRCRRSRQRVHRTYFRH